MRGGVLGTFQNIGGHVGQAKVGHRITCGFEQQDHILAIRDPCSPETHPHATTKRLDIQ